MSEDPKTYTISWRIEGTKEIVAASADEAEHKFHKFTQLQLAEDGLLEADTPELKVEE